MITVHMFRSSSPTRSPAASIAKGIASTGVNMQANLTILKAITHVHITAAKAIITKRSLFMDQDTT